MNNSNKFAIVISFFALWINMFFSFENQQIIGFVVIFLFGILHGANDMALLSKINTKVASRPFKKILIFYITVVFLGVFLFYSIPKIALLLFILFSAYHFGEQHWSKIEFDSDKKSTILFQTVYGLFILSLLFCFHEGEVKNIIFQIINYSITPLDLTWITIVIGFILVLSGIRIYSTCIKFKDEIIINVFYLLVFAIIFKTADLIWAFAIYFVVWHSLPSIKEQINFLYGDCNYKNFIVYFKSAFLYWIISLLGILVLFFVFKDKELFDALFFSFLAAITFPHTFIITRMQNDK